MSDRVCPKNASCICDSIEKPTSRSSLIHHGLVDSSQCSASSKAKAMVIPTRVLRLHWYSFILKCLIFYLPPSYSHLPRQLLTANAARLRRNLDSFRSTAHSLIRGNSFLSVANTRLYKRLCRSVGP